MQWFHWQQLKKYFQFGKNNKMLDMHSISSKNLLYQYKLVNIIISLPLWIWLMYIVLSTGWLCSCSKKFLDNFFIKKIKLQTAALISWYLHNVKYSMESLFILSAIILQFISIIQLFWFRLLVGVERRHGKLGLP